MKLDVEQSFDHFSSPLVALKRRSILKTKSGAGFRACGGECRFCDDCGRDKDFASRIEPLLLLV
jgi:hypothetical protein